MSLRRRLVAVLSLSILVGWLATAFFSYLDARRSIDHLLDDRLRSTATLLVALPGGRHAETGVSSPPGAVAEAGIVYQVWTLDGRMLLRSPGAPSSPLVPLGAAAGFHDVAQVPDVQSPDAWRVFVQPNATSNTVAQVAERGTFRQEMAASIASHIMHPLIIAVPLLAGTIWLSVRWGLRPLHSLVEEVRNRKAEALVPFVSANTPVEVRPLVGALNALFTRISGFIERERRFTGDAAHELRTPLAAIRTHAEVALAAGDEAEQRQALRKTVEGTERATRLVDQLLLLARLDAEAVAARRERCDLRILAAEEIAAIAATAAQRSVILGLEAPENTPVPVLGDCDLLRVLVRNLVDNAVRYVRPRGTVEVIVQRTVGGARLRVVDDGPGIPADARMRVLDRFTRLLGTGAQGSGLGLSIVARIAELHDAELTLADGPDGKGLAVDVAFPGSGDAQAFP